MGVKTYRGPDGGKQKLSVQARRDKQARDRLKASEQYRKDRRSENQSIGQEGDRDLHHTKSGTVRRVSIAYNRATHDRNEVKT